MALCFFALLSSEEILATELKQYLLAAIDAPSGRSDGEMSGPMADFFKGADAFIVAGTGSGQDHQDTSLPRGALDWRPPCCKTAFPRPMVSKSLLQSAMN
jgi:hypothetical protein